MNHRASVARAGFLATTGVAALMVSGALGGSAARADVKVVQETSLTGLEQYDAYSVPRTHVYYYKGNLYRDETKGGDIHIYDAKNDRFFTLNPDSHTYKVTNLEDAMTKHGSVLGGVIVDGTTEVKDGGTTSKIVGRTAQNYALTADVRIRDERNGVQFASIKMNGEQWATSSIPISPACARLAHINIARGPIRYFSLMKPLFDKMDAIKGVPLSYDWNISINVMGDSLSIEAHSEVKGVSTATLPASLFVVPKGYKLVDPTAYESSMKGIES